MRSIAKKAAWLIPLITCGQLIYAQIYTHRYEAGISTGTLIYQGDLTPNDAGSYNTMRPNFGLFVSRILNRSFSAKVNLSFGWLRGDDALYEQPEYRKQRNFKFSTPVTEISAALEWNILAKNARENYKGLSPYIFAGAGASFLNVNRDASRFNSEYFNSEALSAGVAADLAHSTPGATFVLPAGAGLKYALTPRIALFAETSYRFMFTDYLDGFSQGANAKKNDNYHGHSIGVIFSLGYKNRYACPDVAKR